MEDTHFSIFGALITTNSQKKENKNVKIGNLDFQRITKITGVYIGIERVPTLWSIKTEYMSI